MPRSSGQNAMPRRAIRSAVSPIVSLPSNATDPARRPTIPMIDLSVVVLPAPLRPSRVTTSPACTCRSTPCRMWDSPYHACRPFTTSSVSGIAFPQIGLDHLGIPGDAVVLALREDLAPLQHRDPLLEIGHHP